MGINKRTSGKRVSLEQLKTEPGLGQQLKTSACLILGLVLVIWAVEVVNLILGHRLNLLGILPRTISGLPGIVLAPFLHYGIPHVLLNTIPLVILGGLVILHGTRVFLEVSLVIVVVSGVGVWLFGRAGYHVGASGLIFGYFGFLVARSWYERSISSILIAMVTIVLYGSILLGVLPIRSGVSWEAHLFGLISGILAARLISVEAG
jgi:membrane associated rhomboid family serine protease